MTKDMKNEFIHLVWNYPVVCQTPKEDFFKICKDAAGGEIFSVRGRGFFETLKKIRGRYVHAQGRGFPFPEASCLFAKRSVYSPHNDTLGSRWYTKMARRLLYNHYAKIVSQTEFGRQSLIKSGIKSDKVVVLPIPVDYGFFSKPSGGEGFRKKYNLGKGPFALAIGIRPVKNPDLIIKACEMAGIKVVLVGPYEKSDANKTWKGQGFDWYLPKIDPNANKNAIFVGQLDAKQTLAAMDAASIFINSSTYESFGLAVYEAAACGLPLCLPKYESAGQLGTFHAFRECALFHKPDGTESLAKNIKKYINNPKLMSDYGSRSQKIAKQFDYPYVKAMYKKFYSSF